MIPRRSILCKNPGCTTRFTAKYNIKKHFKRVNVKNLKEAEKSDEHS
jgi:hypothetical protein